MSQRGRRVLLNATVQVVPGGRILSARLMTLLAQAKDKYFKNVCPARSGVCTSTLPTLMETVINSGRFVSFATTLLETPAND